MGKQHLTVTDIHGNIVDKNKCKKYKDGYYVINKDCALVNGRWYKLSRNLHLKFDNEQNMWVSSYTTNLIHGIIDIKDDVFIYGYFSANLNNNVIICSINLNHYETVINKFILKNLYIERLDNGIYYPNELYLKFPNIFNTKRISNKYNLKLEYKCNYLLPSITEMFNKHFISKSLLLEESPKSNIYDLLEDTTFGIEYETYDGMIPEQLCKINGLIPVKDGSLRRRNEINGKEYISFEYATIILKGKLGLQAIKQQCELLNKYCDKTHNESLHIHLGNIPPSKEFVVSLYKTIYHLQDEIYLMFPEAMKNTGKFKNKDYCNALPKLKFTDDLEKDFKLIYNFLLAGYEQPFSGFSNNHPADKNNNSKWNIPTRYYITNLITLVFNSQQTTEWRIHPITFDSDSIVNWLYTIVSINKYALKHKDSKISNKITLNNVIKDIYKDYPLLIEALTLYIDCCKKDIQYKKETFNDIIGTTGATISWKDQTSEFIKLI